MVLIRICIIKEIYDFVNYERLYVYIHVFSSTIYDNYSEDMREWPTELKCKNTPLLEHCTIATSNYSGHGWLIISIQVENFQFALSQSTWSTLLWKTCSSIAHTCTRTPSQMARVQCSSCYTMGWSDAKTSINLNKSWGQSVIGSGFTRLNGLTLGFPPSLPCNCIRWRLPPTLALRSWYVSSVV